MAGPGAAADQLLTLRAGGERLALPAGLVREVARLPRLTRVPHAPAALIGVANMRGTVVPVLSLPRMLGGAGGGERRVVLVDDGALFGLAVEAVDALAAANAAGDARTLDLPALLAAALPSQGQEHRATRDVAPAADADAAGETRLALVVCSLGRQAFALPLAAVDEVLRLPATIAAVPHAEAVVVGSASVRGALLPLLSLRALLAMSPVEPSSRTRVLVVRIGAQRVGLVVDAIQGVEHVPEDAIDAVPQVLTRGNAEARIQAICRLDGGERLVSLLAAEHLLADHVAARLATGAGDTDSEDVAMASTGELILLFRIGASDFGLPVVAVDEVVRLPERLARLPNAPSFVKGVMNLRGAVVPVIDQAERFGEAAAAGARRRVIVVRIGDLQAGFVVDAVSEVVPIDAGALQPAPELGGGETRVFERVANLASQDRIVLIVSPRELLDRAEQDLLRGLATAS